MDPTAATEALRAAADTVAASQAEPEFERVPDGYYTRPNVPDHEVAEALERVGAGAMLHTSPRRYFITNR